MSARALRKRGESLRVTAAKKRAEHRLKKKGNTGKHANA